MSFAQSAGIPPEESERYLEQNPVFVDGPTVRYRLRKFLNEGTAGQVYSATDPAGTSVAVKISREIDVTSEVEAFSRLQPDCGRHVLCLYDVFLFSFRGGKWLAMVEELMTGTLADGKLPSEELTAILVQLLLGLDCIHRHGIAHRDVKAANLFYRDGQYKLGDLGLVCAKALQPGRFERLPLCSYVSSYLHPDLLYAPDFRLSRPASFELAVKQDTWALVLSAYAVAARAGLFDLPTLEIYLDRTHFTFPERTKKPNRADLPLLKTALEPGAEIGPLGPDGFRELLDSVLKVPLVDIPSVSELLEFIRKRIGSRDFERASGPEQTCPPVESEWQPSPYLVFQGSALDGLLEMRGLKSTSSYNSAKRELLELDDRAAAGQAESVAQLPGLSLALCYGLASPRILQLDPARTLFLNRALRSLTMPDYILGVDQLGQLPHAGQFDAVLALGCPEELLWPNLASIVEQAKTNGHVYLPREIDRHLDELAPFTKSGKLKFEREVQLDVHRPNGTKKLDLYRFKKT